MNDDRVSKTNPLEAEMRQLREDIDNLQSAIETTIGELRETLYALRNLNQLQSNASARFELLNRKRGNRPN